MIPYNVLIIPAEVSEHRGIHIDSLPTGPFSPTDPRAQYAEIYRAKRMPYPEVLINHVPIDIGARAWRFQVGCIIYSAQKKTTNNV